MSPLNYRYRQVGTDRQIKRLTDRQIGRQADRQAGRQAVGLVRKSVYS